MQKPAPVYSTTLVFHPEQDAGYRHFENAASHPFQPDPATGFPRVNAWWLGEAALASYWPPDAAIPIFANAGLSARYLRHDATDCYLTFTDRTIIVAFRGTEPDDWGDTFTDLQLELVDWPHGRVHRGFKTAVEGIWPQLDAALQELAPTRTVWFCGHSLGAALATLAADRYPRTRGVCTFGSPRVGDAAFMTAFNARLAGRSLRFVNDHDIVTHVPPPVFHYRHVDESRFIDTNGRISQVEPAIRHFFEDIFGTPQQLTFLVNAVKSHALPVAPVALLDHMPKAYAIWTWNDYDAHK